MKRIVVALALSLSAAFAASAGTWTYDFASLGGADWTKDWKVVAGTFKVDGGTIWQTDTSADDNNAFRAVAQTSWDIADGTIEAKVKHDDAATGLNDCLVYYRMKSDNDGYASRLQLDSYITIGKITEGKHAHIKFTANPVVAAQWYTLKIELKGGDIAVSVDDKLLVSATDDWSSKGKVGFGMSRSGAGARLQWIKVTGDGVTGSATPVQPVGKAAATWGALKDVR